jgi:hypothetical protein
MRKSAERRSRPRLTSRAAVLAAVICAITLTLAYPVREYVSQRRQIGRLHAQQQRLGDPAYIEQLARDQLHMCMPTQTCYVIIDGKPAAGLIQPRTVSPGPWYDRLWESVRQANKTPKTGHGTVRH